MHSVQASTTTPILFAANADKKQVEFYFRVSIQMSTEEGKSRGVNCEYKFDIPFSQIHEISVVGGDKSESLMIPLDYPPQVYRKTNNIAATHDPANRVWHERQTWFRQTSISNQIGRHTKPTQIGHKDAIIDIGKSISGFQIV